MIFIVNKINKIQLIQALYIHAAPNGNGVAEHVVRDGRGENVEGLTDEECREIIESHDADPTGYLVDYLKGKPIKLELYKRNGLDLVSSFSYDSRNGAYRFFEAMLNTFPVDEILIYKRNYPEHLMGCEPEAFKRPIHEIAIFKDLLKNAIPHRSELGMFWKIDKKKGASYTPPFMDLG